MQREQKGDGWAGLPDEVGGAGEVSVAVVVVAAAAEEEVATCGGSAGAL